MQEEKKEEEEVEKEVGCGKCPSVSEFYDHLQLCFHKKNYLDVTHGCCNCSDFFFIIHKN